MIGKFAVIIDKAKRHKVSSTELKFPVLSFGQR